MQKSHLDRLMLYSYPISTIAYQDYKACKITFVLQTQSSFLFSQMILNNHIIFTFFVHCMKKQSQTFMGLIHVPVRKKKMKLRRIYNYINKYVKAWKKYNKKRKPYVYQSDESEFSARNIRSI